MDPSTPKFSSRFGAEVRIALVLCLANLAIFGYYLWNESLAPNTFHLGRLIGGVLVMAGAGGIVLRGAIGGLLRGLQLSLFSIALLFAALQLHFQTFPQYWPQNIQNIMTVEDTARLRRRIIEYLPHSPYAKPLPNISFTIPGFYSPSSDFDYEFVTDRRGFKNLRELDGRDQFDVVVRYAKWLAILGDWAYVAALGANSHLNFLRRRAGLKYWSLSAYLKHRVKQAVSFIGDFENALVEAARGHDAEGVICGHIHHAAKREVKGMLYVNLGDWVESATAVGETMEGSFEIIRWLDVIEQRQAVAQQARPTP